MKRVLNLRHPAVSIVALALSFAAFGCSHDQRAKTANDQATATTYTEKNATTTDAKFARVAQIDFAKGTYALTDAEKNELSSLVRTASANGKIDEVKVLAWADRDIAGSNKKATSNEVDLADKRASAVRAYIRDQLKFKDIDTHNMAESPNAVSRLFKTDDYEMKTGMYDQNGAVFKPSASPQKVMVLVEMETDND